MYDEDRETTCAFSVEFPFATVVAAAAAVDAAVEVVKNFPIFFTFFSLCVGD